MRSDPVCKITFVSDYSIDIKVIAAGLGQASSRCNKLEALLN